MSVKKKICIIGGGPSGCFMAYKLKNLFDVVILEKEKEKGGHAIYHVDDNKNCYPMCMIFNPQKFFIYDNIIDYFVRKLKIPTTPVKMAFYLPPDYRFSLLDTVKIFFSFLLYCFLFYVYNYIWDFGELKISKIIKVFPFFDYYIYHYNNIFFSLSGVHMSHDYDVRSLLHFEKPFRPLMLTLNVLFGGSGLYFLENNGFAGIIEHFVEGVNIKYNVDIKKIIREGGKIKIIYHDRLNFNEIVDVYDKVVVSCYPEYIVNTLNNITPIEKKYLLYNRYYYSKNVYTFLADVEWEKEPFIFLKNKDDDNIKFIYFAKNKNYYFFGAESLSEPSYKKIDEFITLNGGRLKKILKMILVPKYVLFYDTHDIILGIDKELQGHNNMYYANSLMCGSGLTTDVLKNCENVANKIINSLSVIN